MVQNSRDQRGRESQKVIFFEGLSGRVKSEKRRDKRREEEYEGVKSVYLPKESDSRLPANNPFWLLHFFPTPYPLPLILSFTLFPSLPPSLSPRACFQKRPRQFTVTLHHLFSLFLIFPFSSACISFLNQIYMGFCRPPSLSLSFKHSLMFSSTTVTAFYLDISKARSFLSKKNVSIVHMVLDLFMCLSVCVCVIPCLYSRMCVGLSISCGKYSDAFRRCSESHHSYYLHAVVNFNNHLCVYVCICVCVFACGHSIPRLLICGQG